MTGVSSAALPSNALPNPEPVQLDVLKLEEVASEFIPCALGDSTSASAAENIAGLFASDPIFGESTLSGDEEPGTLLRAERFDTHTVDWLVSEIT